PRTRTAEETATRVRALQDARKADEETRKRDALLEQDRRREEEERAAEDAQRRVEEELRQRTEAEEAKKRGEEETKKRADEEEARRREDESRREVAERAGKAAAAKVAALAAAGKVAVPAEEEEETPAAARPGRRPEARRPTTPVRRDEHRRRTGKLTVTRALDEDAGERMRSLASVRRARERERMRMHQEEPLKIVRDVVIPETITIQELANRMAERGADVIKALMRMGVMATINQVVDADTAELLVNEFGHKLRRVSESDVLIGLTGAADEPEVRQPRAPVVTVMGHVDHAKAAGVPVIVAVNKIDKPEANPTRVKTDLLQHGLVAEDMGGETLAVEVSAKTGAGLDRLKEAIVLQAELLDLRANPNRPGEGAIIEAKLERGRGAVATLLVQNGSIKVGDIFVAGAEWGRVRALIDDKGQQIEVAGPSSPVEVLGLNGTPLAGDEFAVVEDEARARDVADF